MLYCHVSADSRGTKPRAEAKNLASRSVAAADIAGAMGMGMFCNISHDTVSPVNENKKVDSTSTTTDDPPALPPRKPIYNKPPSGPSCRKSRSRTSGHSSSGSVIPSGAVIVAHENLPLSYDDSLDVFIPSSPGVQTICDGNSVSEGVRDETDHQTQSTLSGLESEQTAFVNVSAESQKYIGNDEDGGLDVVIGTEDESDDEKQSSLGNDVVVGGLDVVVGTENEGDSEKQALPTSSEPEQKSFVNASADSLECLDNNDDASGYRSRYNGQTSKRIRPDIVRRLTRKETSKLSRKLTRKMSCRQQHALMMTTEFDEFDELDVVVESGSVTDDDDDVDDGGKLSAAGSGCKDRNDDELPNVSNSNSSDAGFDDVERVTTKLHYDRLQVTFTFCSCCGKMSGCV